MDTMISKIEAGEEVIITGPATIARIERNIQIHNAWLNGEDIYTIAEENGLTRRMVRRIIRKMQRLAQVA